MFPKYPSSGTPIIQRLESRNRISVMYRFVLENIVRTTLDFPWCIDVLFSNSSWHSSWTPYSKEGRVRVVVFNATFNNTSVISWRSVLLMKETGVPAENHRPVASHWQTLSQNVVSSTPRLSRFEPTTLVVICTDCNCHTIMTTTLPKSKSQ